MAKSGSLPRGESLSRAWRLGDAPIWDGPYYIIPRVEELGCVDGSFPLVVEGECDGFVVSPPLNTAFSVRLVRCLAPCGHVGAGLLIGDRPGASSVPERAGGCAPAPGRTTSRSRSTEFQEREMYSIRLSQLALLAL
eukprot:scaffold10787_cov123-Isochrysis_galbana.AAC.7